MSERFLGCLPRETKVGDGTFPVVGDVEKAPLIPESEWVDVDYDNAWMTMDQSRQNSCASATTAGIIMHAREQAGLPKVQISQASIYRFVNGGRDMGSSVDANLRQAMEVGATPIDVIDQYDWQGRNWPSNWKEVAANYRIAEAYDCPDYNAAVSCVQRGVPVAIGVDWGMGGHAIYIVGFRKRDGACKIRNSHGDGYGINGTDYLPKSQVARGIPKYGAWGVRAASLHG